MEPSTLITHRSSLKNQESQPSTLNSQPSSLTNQPSALITQRPLLNPQSSSLNPHHSTLITHRLSPITQHSRERRTLNTHSKREESRSVGRSESASVGNLLLNAQIVYPEPLPSKEEQFNAFQGLLSESQGQHLALTVLYVPCSLDSGWLVRGFHPGECL